MADAQWICVEMGPIGGLRGFVASWAHAGTESKTNKKKMIIFDTIYNPQ